jgi:hypothetical protein
VRYTLAGALLWLMACSQTQGEQCVIERRGVSREVVRVSGDCGQQDFTGVDLGRADVSGVTWGGATCPDGAQAAQVGGSCEGHLSPRQDEAPDLPLDADPDVIEDAPEVPEDIPSDPTEDSPRDQDDAPPDLRDDPDANSPELADEGPEDQIDDQGGECGDTICDPNARCVDGRCVCGEGFEGDGAFCLGQTCYAARFNGVDTWVDTDFQGFLQITPRTYELWVYVAGPETEGTLLFIEDVFALTPSFWRLRLDGGDELQVQQETEARYTRLRSGPLSLEGRWVHVAITLPSMGLFVDGVPTQLNGEGPRSLDPELDGTPLAVGATLGDITEGQRLLEDVFNGLMRELRVSSGVKRAATFETPWRHPVEEDTLALWRMSEGEGDELHDLGPSAVHVLFRGDAQWEACGVEP